MVAGDRGDCRRVFVGYGSESHGLDITSCSHQWLKTDMLQAWLTSTMLGLGVFALVNLLSQVAAVEHEIEQKESKRLLFPGGVSLRKGSEAEVMMMPMSCPE